MRPTGLEPTPDELMLLLDDEERGLFENPDVSDRDKAEILAKLQTRRDVVVEQAVEDEPLSETQS
jgi:hypothetical protein